MNVVSLQIVQIQCIKRCSLKESRGDESDVYQFTFKNQSEDWRHIFSGKLIYVPRYKLTQQFASFADIISPRRWHILLGPFRAIE